MTHVNLCSQNHSRGAVSRHWAKSASNWSTHRAEEEGQAGDLPATRDSASAPSGGFCLLLVVGECEHTAVIGVLRMVAEHMSGKSYIL